MDELMEKRPSESQPAPVKLNDATLQSLPTAILRPKYDRASLSAGILHIGVGNFHRAHQAWYLHRLMQEGEAFDWAIVGAGIRSYDETQRKKLKAQDYLTTLIQLNPLGSSAEVTGAMIDYVPVDTNNAPLIHRMSQPDIRIVSLTVTEGGYYIDPVTKTFNAKHPDILHDAECPDQPITAFGAMVAALKQRRQTGAGPFTGLCCDNLQGNGEILRQTVVSLAQLTDPDLADWINTNCSFPNSMVDCIVPATGPNELRLASDIGVNDAVPVTHEEFRQWVIEDDFCAQRPAWEKVGVTITKDIHGYEAMKIRLLNGGHQVISNVGELLGVKTIADCMAHEQIAALLNKVAREEIAPHVQSVPGKTPAEYIDLIVHRFSNPRIADTTRRVAFDGSSRHPGFLIPSLRDAIAKGSPFEGLALAEAAWARMCEGTREDGSTIEPNDPNWDELHIAATRSKQDPAVWRGQRQYYGDLADNPEFSDAFDRWLGLIWDKGIGVAIDTYLGN
ncbi:mannitol dehydrogenase family protein [Maritalea porphyrae]|nr:mannitol dehydrogenase family protein [Maritalea porphyrae]